MTDILLSPLRLSELEVLIKNSVRQGIENQSKESPNISTESKIDRYINTDEVAKIYDVSKVTVNDWDNKGIIIGYRLGNTKRYKLSEIMTAPKLIIRKKK